MAAGGLDIQGLETMHRSYAARLAQCFLVAEDKVNIARLGWGTGTRFRTGATLYSHRSRKRRRPQQAGRFRIPFYFKHLPHHQGSLCRAVRAGHGRLMLIQLEVIQRRWQKHLGCPILRQITPSVGRRASLDGVCL